MHINIDFDFVLFGYVKEVVESRAVVMILRAIGKLQSLRKVVQKDV
jgi:hypothetical protein